MSDQHFGWLQLRILHVLWEKGRANARDITDALNEIEPIAHSTVQTLLRRMEGKGAIAHKVEDRTFSYYPVIEPEKVAGNAVRDIIDYVFSGSPEGLVSYLLKAENISFIKLKELRNMIDDKEM